MDKDTIISVQNVTKTYRLYDSHINMVKEVFHPFRKKYHHLFNAVNNVSFEVKRGDAIGIIGQNGSGKSTLLQIICGVLQPTSGSVEVRGRVSALLELGAGFNPEFTGRENVYLNGAILGFSREEIDELFDEIIDFADIGEFIEHPVKTYSSGMYVRLAFAVQACVEPDVLIVDEVLSVGDIFFQQKCHARMEKLLSRNTIIIFVSHDMTAIEKYSEHTMLLNQGCCVFFGQPNEAVERYYQIAHSSMPKVIPGQLPDDTDSHVKMATTETNKIGDWPSKSAFLDLSKAVLIGEKDIARCTGVALCNNNGQPSTTFLVGDVASFYFEFELLKDCEVPVGGVVLTDTMNLNIHGKNSLQYLLKAPQTTKKGTRIRFRQRIQLDVAPGEYSFQVGLASIGAEDYARVKDMTPEQLNENLWAILRVRQAGVISIYRRNGGLSIPFYGYTDLKGDSTLSILE